MRKTAKTALQPAGIFATPAADVFHSSAISFLDHLPGLTWIINQEGDFIYLNERLLQAFGLSKKDIGKNIRQLFSGAFVQQYLTNNKKVFAGKKTVYAYEDAVLPDGSFAKYKSVKFLFEHGGTQVLGGIALDITAEWRMKEKAEQDNRRFELINQATSEVLWDIDLVTGRHTRGGSIEKVFGYKPGADDEAVDFAHVHPQERAGVQASFAKALSSKSQVWEEVYRVRCAKGQYHTIINKAVIVRNESGAAVQVVGSARNISNEVKLRDALIAKEQEMRRLTLQHIVNTQERERREVAYELHENLAQMLATANQLVELGCSTYDQSIVKRGQHVLKEAITVLRNLQQKLNPDSIRLMGLEPVLIELAGRAMESGKYIVTLAYTKKADGLNDDQKLTIFRILQKQLRNVDHHAQATQVHIEIKIVKGWLQFSVADDGVGFHVPHAKPGMGITNMNNRLELLGGNLRFVSAPGKGCKMIARFPV